MSDSQRKNPSHVTAPCYTCVLSSAFEFIQGQLFSLLYSVFSKYSWKNLRSCYCFYILFSTSDARESKHFDTLHLFATLWFATLSALSLAGLPWLLCVRFPYRWGPLVQQQLYSAEQLQVFYLLVKTSLRSLAPALENAVWNENIIWQGFCWSADLRLLAAGCWLDLDERKTT